MSKKAKQNGTAVEREDSLDMKEITNENEENNGLEVSFDETEFTVDEIDAMDASALQHSINRVNLQIEKLEMELGEDAYDEESTIEGESSESDDDLFETFVVPEHCIPIRKDVRLVEWDALGREVQFDVIVMDPPWQLASAAPTRGVAIAYKQLPNKDIMDLPIPKLQKNGFLFIWVINARYSFALEMFEKWGYELCDDITWVKTTCNRRLAKGHGFYLQHAKETCLVGKKGADPPNMRGNIGSDVLFGERRGQSQKPEELYEMIEQLVPNGDLFENWMKTDVNLGKYLEIFARRNNLRNYWVSIGLEL